MNRFSMLAKGPKASKRVFSPGAPSSVPTPGERKQRPLSVAPGPASTRMYGKSDQPTPGAGMFGSPSEDSNV